MMARKCDGSLRVVSADVFRVHAQEVFAQTTLVPVSGRLQRLCVKRACDDRTCGRDWATHGADKVAGVPRANELTVPIKRWDHTPRRDGQIGAEARQLLEVTVRQDL